MNPIGLRSVPNRKEFDSESKLRKSEHDVDVDQGQTSAQVTAEHQQGVGEEEDWKQVELFNHILVQLIDYILVQFFRFLIDS